MVTSTGEPLESVVCNKEGWLVDRTLSKLVFFDDGTGKMFLIGEHVAWIALWFDWKPEAGYIPTKTVNTDRITQKSQLLAEFKIKFSLTKKMISTDEWFHNDEGRVPLVNQLHETAFVPRTLVVRLEKGGKFRTEADCRGDDHEDDDDCTKFALRLVMEPSPFPALEHWQDPSNGAKQSKFWEIHNFVGRQLSESEARDPWWDLGTLLRRTLRKSLAFYKPT